MEIYKLHNGGIPVHHGGLPVNNGGLPVHNVESTESLIYYLFIA